LSEVAIVDDVDALCNVFERAFGAQLMDADDKDTVVETAKQKLQDSHLHRLYDFGSALEMKQTVICERTSQFTRCCMWIDEDSEERRVFIMETEVAADEFK